jgi:hypothetical protein
MFGFQKHVGAFLYCPQSAKLLDSLSIRKPEVVSEKTFALNSPYFQRYHFPRPLSSNHVS